ncbi:M23 family metallopeptidase [Phenylobacterium sp.]|uniref:M23 family metallopeptidase n=1 Tax=Phenylobacterium sp. TaxID=1871053 RepID=UPI003983A2B1
MELNLARSGRAPHWIMDAVLGGFVALGAITMAHAALPDKIAVVSAPAPAVSLALAAFPAAPQEPAALISFQQPVPGRDIVSPFGLRQMPWEAHGRLHAGVDISAHAGELILAVADGVVVETGQNSSYGRFVEVRHAEGLSSFYAHMGAVGAGVALGAALKAGDSIGRIGSTGTSTGPHLHLEIRDQRDRPLNPSLFLGRAFAEADDLPLQAASRVPRRVRVAHVSSIPESKRALMEAKLQLKTGKAILADSAPVLGAQARAEEAAQQIDGLDTVSVTPDGRARARLTL